MADGTVVVNLNDDNDDEEELLFQDIPHTDVQTENEDRGKSQTRSHSKFSRSANDDDEDRTDLLEGQKKQPSFWSFEYYQSFFDVNTGQVVRRIVWSMYPNPRYNYLQTQIRPVPDLYGPFWICITLVFTIAVAGNLANYFHSAGTDNNWKYDFHKVTVASSTIFAYWWLMPTILYGLLWWRKNPAGYTFSELLCVYGYSLAIYIPISILWVIQVTWLQWLLVIVGMLLSGAVLVLTVSPGFKNDQKQIFLAVVSIIVIFHGLLAVGFMLYFFHMPTTSTSLHTTVTSAPIVNVTSSLSRVLSSTSRVMNNTAE